MMFCKLCLFIVHVSSSAHNKRCKNIEMTSLQHEFLVHGGGNVATNNSNLQGNTCCVTSKCYLYYLALSKKNHRKGVGGK